MYSILNSRKSFEAPPWSWRHKCSLAHLSGAHGSRDVQRWNRHDLTTGWTLKRSCVLTNMWYVPYTDVIWFYHILVNFFHLLTLKRSFVDKVPWYEKRSLHGQSSSIPSKANKFHGFMNPNGPITILEYS